MTTKLSKKLAEFQAKNKILSKGKLSTVLTLTRRIREEGLPFPLEQLKTKEKGQVARLGAQLLQKILTEYGIKRVLAKEGGRTSRGSLGLAEKYADLLNELHASGILQPSEVAEIEKWWIEKIKDYFNQQSFTINLDPSYSIGALITSLLKAARVRQKEVRGTTIEGAVIHYMVGAKLRLIAPDLKFDVRGYSVADDPTSQKGDYLLGDAVVHATTAPSDALMTKCSENLDSGFRPIIVCPQEKVATARGLADNVSLQQRIDIFDIEQFVSLNLNEKGRFMGNDVRLTMRSLVDKYNEIIDDVESDLSLKIQIS